MKTVCAIFLITLLLLSTNSKAQDYNWDTTLVINKRQINIATIDSDDDFIRLVATNKGKIIFEDKLYKNGLANAEVMDFNQDQNPDIQLTYLGNNPTYFLYIYNSIENKFVNIKGFDKYPQPIKLKKDSNIYYSYHRAGCADMNWVSDLFKIENYEVIHLGHIYGQGCDYEVKRNPQQIQIYKVLANNSEKKTLFHTLPYKKVEAYKEDKWGFIDDYWNKNYSKFK
jgi:hypothetical protein